MDNNKLFCLLIYILYAIIKKSYKGGVSIKNSRQFGIDLLKILAMLFILILHIISRGGLFRAVSADSLQYKVLLSLDIFCLVSVNIYGLISGYLNYSSYERKGCKDDYSFKRLIYLQIQVVFYIFIIYLLLHIFGIEKITGETIIKILFPVSTKYLWYYTAFFLLYFFMPLINSFVKNCNNELLIKMSIFIILIFSFLQSLFAGYSGDFANLLNGYSFFWLFILYYLGAVIKKTNFCDNCSTVKIIISMIILYILTFACKFYFPMFNVFDGYLNNFLYSYISPTILIISIFYLLLFKKIKINNKVLKKIIPIFSAATFGVYVIHLHSFIWDKIDMYFTFILNYKICYIPFIIIGIASLCLLCLLIVDIGRYYLFKLLKIDSFCEYLDKKIKFVLNKIIKILPFDRSK